jgi:Ca2+-binding EF-hand superfamily protein
MRLDYSGKKFTHAKKDSAGVWDVPKEGRLAFIFSLEAGFEAACADIELFDFTSFLKRYLAIMKISPSFRKLVPLMAHFKNAEAIHDEEQYLILDALGRDLTFTYPQMKQLCNTRMTEIDVLSRMLPCLAGGPGEFYLTMSLLPCAVDYIALVRRQPKFLGFNAQNPTGRYNLDLSNNCDYEVAQQLLLLDRWEAQIAQKLKHRDISQRGDGSRIRNETYNGSSIDVQALLEWKLPESGKFDFDYSSSKCPPKGAKTLDAIAYARILVGLQLSQAAWPDQVNALRMVSHLMWVDCLQVRELLGLYRTEAVRSNLFVTLFSRITDLYNEKLVRVRFETRKSLAEIRHRLGYVSFFPFIQLEQTYFELDFAKHDQRMVANVIFQICAKESWLNISKPMWTHKDGTKDPLIMGIPRSWETPEKMPVEGIFQGTYNCAPQDRNFKERKRLFQMHLSGSMPEEESSVRWWAVPTETPLDVLMYLEFLVAKFPSLQAAFKYVDRICNEDGNISSREFEESIKKMNCRKFDGAEKKQRILAIFRYLDPSGEGQVSASEFQILDLLFQEVQLSIKEFVQFLDRTYGPELEEAWKALDVDGSGDIDATEWKDILMGVGFFGNSRAIFSFMDKDDGGSISLEEFSTLSEFKRRLTPEERRRNLRSQRTQESWIGSPG